MNVSTLRAALYARYSTDRQSEASIEDQLRVAERIAEREGFRVAARFHDRGISGGTVQRPGYQELLAAARRHEFEVIVAEDTSRLWRNLAEQAPRLAELADLGIAVVTHDLDTRHESAEIMGAVGGAMATAYRKEIGRRTRRGVEGLARAGKSTGGRAFGYLSATDSPSRQPEINPDQAPVVRRIFEMYADGYSPRAIASKLNVEGIPSPGATWRRSATGLNAKRAGKWVASCIHGDVTRGTGILNNPRYTGRIVWGRTRWVRGAADSSVRLSRKSEEPVIEYTDERLRIISDDLWYRVKARQLTSRKASERVRNALRPLRGKPPRHLLSGLLVCEECGSSFTRINQRTYGCSGHRNGGAATCQNAWLIGAQGLEQRVLGHIEQELLAPEILRAATEAYRAEIARAETPPAAASPAIARKDAEIEQLRQMVRSGVMAAATLQPAIDAAERERAHLISQVQQRGSRDGERMLRLLPEAAAQVRATLSHLAQASEILNDGEMKEARQLLFELVGGRVPVRHREDGATVLRLDLDFSPIVGAYKSTSSNLVAGAGFEPATFGL